MENRIFKNHDREGDYWCEHAIVFPKDKPLLEVFTHQNMRKVLNAYEDEQDYPIVAINQDKHSVIVTFYHGEDDSGDEFVFVEMSSVLIIN